MFSPYFVIPCLYRRVFLRYLDFIILIFVSQDSHTHSALNGSVPTERSNSSGPATMKKPVRSNSNEAPKKPPVPPAPYASKSASLPQNQPANLTDRGLRDQGLSPIKKKDTISASTPNLSTVSSQSDDSPEMKTSTPESKRRRRAAPPPPPRPAAPKALFTEVKPDAQVDSARLPMKNGNNNLTAVATSNLSQVPAASEVKMNSSQKKRPAPPRPNRPPPPQPAPKVPKQGSLESKDVNEAGKQKEISVQLKQKDEEGTSFDRAALSLDLGMRPHSDSLGEELEEDRLSDLRGIPIFIPPPPPDELPPPLDECETPVGPLTDLETDILEGKDRKCEVESVLVRLTHVSLNLFFRVLPSRNVQDSTPKMRNILSFRRGSFSASNCSLQLLDSSHTNQNPFEIYRVNLGNL